MNESLQSFGLSGSMTQQRNRVLRNTYWLLALSMVPTVLGAWVGVSTGIVTGLSTLMSFVVFMAGMFGFMFAIERTKNSGAGVPVLLAFTFFMGVMLSRLLAFVLTKGNGASLIMTAFGGTALVFAGMATLASVIKRDLSGMGKTLTIGMLVIFAAGIINMFVQSSALMLTLSVMCIGLFSAYLVYDLKRIIDGGETNYITATMSLYIDIYGIFQNLLALLGIFGGSDD